MRFLSVGDRALTVEFGDRVDRAVNDAVLRLDQALRAEPPFGVIEAVPTFRSLTIHYDPSATSRADLERAVAHLVDETRGSRRDARRWRVPVCYEGAFAPDLAEVARLTRLAPAEIVTLHHAPGYRVYMLGFLPGFPYLGDLPEALRLPRRAEPRLRVPAGSVSIATSLTAIYPYESPGGWHLVGVTPIRLFDPARSPPALLAPGDAVVFEPIDAGSFSAIRRAVAAGEYGVDSDLLDECPPA
ncbi:MAG: 5-oxoprolinase subunit PxpB [Stellaceae bacterium]